MCNSFNYSVVFLQKPRENDKRYYPGPYFSEGKDGKTETEIEIGGRHDSAIIPRACVVAETVAAFTVADALITKYGTDYLK